MAKSENQKLKLLYIVQFLEKYTDENHYMTTQELIEKLDEVGIKAERKSIYHDISCLMEYGYEIEKKPSKLNGGFYMKKHTFELPELKLLVDEVSASKYITPSKSKELIQKLEALASVHEAKQLQRQVYVANRIKSQNESIFDNVDMIHNAILENRMIQFRYYEYTIEKKIKYRREGKNYIISPWAVTVADENYYLIGYDSEAGIIKHYRIDKMSEIQVLNEKRDGKEMFGQMDIVEYTNKMFGMFAGTEELITIQFPNHLIGVVIDRFGKDIDIRKRDENHFSIRARLLVSNQLYGWLAGMGPDIKILMPQDAHEKYVDYLKTLIGEL